MGTRRAPGPFAVEPVSKPTGMIRPVSAPDLFSGEKGASPKTRFVSEKPQRASFYLLYPFSCRVNP
jgi:hypothetical protein